MNFLTERIFFFAVGLLFCSYADAQLLNEGFENAALGYFDTLEHVPGWEITAWDGATADFSIVDEQVNSGNQALKIEVRTVSGTNPVEVFAANKANTVLVPGDTILKISFYAKGSRDGQRIRLDVRRPDNWTNLATREFSLSTEYERYSMDYYSYATQEIGIYLNFAYRKYDVYWLDDIRFDTETIPPPPGLDSLYKRSDIVFTVTQSYSVYQQFNADMVSWGWLPTPLTASKIATWKGTVKQVQTNGVRYQGRAEVDAGWRNMLEYDPDGFQDDIVTTLNGKKVVAPWFEGRYHDGHPAYWFCTNSAGFQDFLRHQVSILVSGDVNSIMFDAQVGTPLPVKQAGGCFCDHCVAGFRSYMEEKYSVQELQNMGISDIQSFNYGDFLRAKGWNESSYINQSRRDNPAIPLFGDFQEYQYRGLNNLTSELSKLADRLAGKPVVFSSSSNPDQHFRSVFVPEVDYYTQELHLQASSLKVPYTPVLNYAMADALEKGMDLTGIPQWDWNVINDKDRPALVRSWIAQAYAYGARFIVPIWNWAGGFDYYYGDPQEYEYIYDFIQDHSSLFDGYDLSAQVGLVMPYEGLRYGTDVVNYAIKGLMEKNIPFQLVISGGKWWDKKLDEWDLKRSTALALNSDFKYLNLSEKTLLNRYSPKSASASDTASIFAILPRQINVSAGNKKVNVVPRANPDSPDVPNVIHLVNMQYNESNIAMDTVKDFTISFKNSLFNREIIEATLYRPGKSSLNLVMDSIDDGFSVEIPELLQWGLIRMKSQPTKKVTFQIYGKNENGEVWTLPETEIKTGRNYVRTDSEGEAAIRQIPGEISYMLERKGYAHHEGNFTFTNDTIILDTLEYITYDVTVHVTDETSGEDLEGSQVMFGEQEGTTDGSGMILFSGLGYGTYQLEASKEQYKTFQLEDAELYSDSLFNLSLSRNRHAVTFHLVDSASGVDLQGVEVQFNQQQRITEANGITTVHTPFGEHHYSMGFTDYDTIRGVLQVQADTTLLLKMLRIQSTVTFRVTHNGVSVYKAEVMLNGISKETNSVGMVGFETVPVYENLTYSISKEGFQRLEGEIYLYGDSTVRVDIHGVGIEERVSGGIRIYPNPVNKELSIAGPGGDMYVELLDMTGKVLISQTLTGVLKKLNLDEVPKGIYLLKVIPDGSDSRIFRIIRE